MPSAPRWHSPRRSPGSPIGPMPCRTRSGKRPPGTTTRPGSPPLWSRSRASTPGTASTLQRGRSPATGSASGSPSPPIGRREGISLMDDQQWLAERFEEHRPRLRAVAYRMLGSLSEADDAVQDAWLRVSRADTSEVENLGAWLTTIVARVSLNLLRSRKTRREASLDDVHVPDPVIERADGTDPEHEAL